MPLVKLQTQAPMKKLRHVKKRQTPSRGLTQKEFILKICQVFKNVINFIVCKSYLVQTAKSTVANLRQRVLIIDSKQQLNHILFNTSEAT